MRHRVAASVTPLAVQTVQLTAPLSAQWGTYAADLALFCKSRPITGMYMMSILFYSQLSL